MKHCYKILNAEEIDRIVTRMTYEILEIHRGTKNLALVGIHTRGVFLADRICKKIHQIEHVEIPTGTIDITLYRDDWTRIGPNPLVHKTKIDFPLEDHQVILVDDVLFTGRTIRAAMDALIDYGRPDRIELAVLMDRRGHRELPIQANYIGKRVETHRDETISVLFSEVDGLDEVVIETHGSP